MTTLKDLLYAESVLRDELDAVEELTAIDPRCAARMRPALEIEADLDSVRDELDLTAHFTAILGEPAGRVAAAA